MTNKTLSFADLPAEKLVAICDYLRGDGHGMYDPNFLVELDVPQEHVESVTDTYTSDTSSPKSTIFGHDGEVIPETRAIYSLSLYRRINGDLGLPGSGMIGRGFEARELDKQIREHLK